ALLGDSLPRQMAELRSRGSWIAHASLPSPAYLAAGVAVTIALGPWLTRQWRRAAWIAVVVVAVMRVVTGTALPFEVLLACAIGAVVGAAVLVVFGAPDRRIGADEVAAVLVAAGLPVTSVALAPPGKGSRLFLAA